MLEVVRSFHLFIRHCDISLPAYLHIYSLYIFTHVEILTIMALCLSQISMKNQNSQILLTISTFHNVSSDYWQHFVSKLVNTSITDSFIRLVLTLEKLKVAQTFHTAVESSYSC